MTSAPTRPANHQWSAVGLGLMAVLAACAGGGGGGAGGGGGGSSAPYVHHSGLIIPAGYPNPDTTGWAALGITEASLVASDQIYYGTDDSGTSGHPRVYSGLKVRGHDIRLQQGAHDITFRGCDFSNQGDWAVYLEAGVSNIRFEYCTFHGEDHADDRAIDATSTRLQNGIWSAGENGPWTVDHGRFYWVADGVYTNGNDVTVTESCFHDFTYWSGDWFAPNGDHTNALGPVGGSSTRHLYQHNSLVMIRWNGAVFDQTSCVNLAQDDPTAYADITIDDNFLVGNQGGHLIAGYEPGKGGAPGQRIRITNNHHSAFGTASPPRAAYASQPTWNAAPANNVWTGNTWWKADGSYGGAVAPVTP
jgi:hypothetical protein